MGTKTYNNYEDLLTFTRASEGHALRPVSYGDEIINNGDFELGDNGDWGVSTNWTISGGVATLVGGDGVYGNSGLYQVIDLDVGKIYKVSLDVSGLTGTFRVYHASYSTGTNIDSTGTLVFNIVGESGGTRLNILGNNGSAVTLDNISVKEVLFDQPDGTLTLFPHPENVPRVEYDADGNRLGLLVEESRTNLVTYSEDFSQWTGFSDPNEILAPDGTLTATKVRDNNQGTTATVTINEPVTVSTSTTYTYSVFGKKGQLNWMALGVINFTTPSNARVWFDLDNGVVGTEGPALSGAIEEFPNGWYRCSVTFTTDAADTFGQLYIYVCEDDGEFANTNRDGTSDIYVWGAQLEAGSFPTSYIKSNSGSTTTRSADVASIPVADFGYNQSEGTVVVEAKTFSNAEANHGDFALTDSGTSADLSSGSRTGSSVAGSYSTWYRTAGTTQANLVRTSAVEDNVFYKAGFCYKANDFAQSVDGGSILSDSSGTVPSRNSVVLIGDNYYGKLNGHIKSIKYFPRRLTNAQLVDLTS
jgi:hypothetical protein